MNFFLLTLVSLLILGASGSKKGCLSWPYSGIDESKGLQKGELKSKPLSKSPTSSFSGLRDEGYVCAFTWDPKDVEDFKYLQLNVILPDEVVVKVQMILSTSGAQEVDIGDVEFGGTVSATITTQEDWSEKSPQELLISSEHKLESDTECQVKLYKP